MYPRRIIGIRKHLEPGTLHHHFLLQDMNQLFVIVTVCNKTTDKRFKRVDWLLQVEGQLRKMFIKRFEQSIEQLVLSSEMVGYQR